MAIKTINGSIEGVLPNDLLKLLSRLTSKKGEVIDMNTLKVVHLNGAMTNQVYRISWQSKIQENQPQTVLVRLYGEGVERFFNREEEIQTFNCMSEHGHGPKLLEQTDKGRVEEFIHGRTLSAADLRDPEISALIAAKLREFHNLDMPGSKTVVLWDRMRNWLNEAKSLASQEHAEQFGLNKLEQEISMLEHELSTDDNQCLAFCHNDLQYGNIMIDEKTRSITLIDYEYASYNPIVYDFANHFCEMAANYHTDTPHVLDYHVYPSIDERHRFIRAYLTSADYEPSDEEVEKLAVDAEKYTLANHLFWGLWGIISKYVNKIEFDYMEYAKQRFDQYWLKKPVVIKDDGWL